MGLFYFLAPISSFPQAFELCINYFIDRIPIYISYIQNNIMNDDMDKKLPASTDQLDHHGSIGLLNIILDLEDATINITRYLSVKDTLSFDSVNLASHKLISNQEDRLFKYFLCRDFAEGRVLSYIAQERKLSYKRLYLAFLHRFSLQKYADQLKDEENKQQLLEDEDSDCNDGGKSAEGDNNNKMIHKRKKKRGNKVTDSSKRVIIPWSRPRYEDLETRSECEDDYEFPEVKGECGHWDTIDSDNDAEEEDGKKQQKKKIPLRPVSKNDDVASLVFIARVGNDDNPNTCVLMDWEYYGTECGERGKKLVIDYHRNRDIWKSGTGFCLPATYSPKLEADEVTNILKSRIGTGAYWVQEFDKAVQESPSYYITLHAVDVKEYKVASLMDGTSVGKYGMEDGIAGGGGLLIDGYGSELPKVYGIPKIDSPNYRNYTVDDYPINGFRGPGESPSIDVFDISADLSIKFHWYDKGIQLFPLFPDGLHFHFEIYGQSVIYICSFFRALINEKCAVMHR